MLVSVRTRGQDRTRRDLGAVAAGLKRCQAEAHGADVAQTKVVVPSSQSRSVAAGLATTASLKGLAPDLFVHPTAWPELAHLTVRWQSL